MRRTKSSDPNSIADLCAQLFQSQDSLSLARIYARWALERGGLSSAELIWPDLAISKGTPVRLERWGREPKTRATKVLSVRFRDENGIFFCIHFLAAGGQKVGAAAIREIKEGQKLVEKAILANEKRQQEEEIRRFTWVRYLSAGLSHELNTPFTTLLYYLKKLTKAEMPNPLQVQLEKTVSAIGKVLGQYQQLAGDGTQAELQSVALHELMTRLQRTYSAPSVQFVCEDPKATLSIRADEIQRAVGAVIANAVDAVERRKKLEPNFEGQILVRAKTRAGLVAISVTDNGSGIPVEDRPFVFAPFFTRKDINEGMGLGLSIARSIAFLHDGTLRLNPLSEHTQFILEIPLSAISLSKKGQAA